VGDREEPVLAVLADVGADAAASAIRLALREKTFSALTDAISRLSTMSPVLLVRIA
jgi:hypothetical protein